MIHRGGTRFIILICAIFYLLQHTYSPAVLETLGLACIDNPKFNIIQLLSYGFLHGNTYHICANIILIAIFGSRIQKVFGTWNFLMLFLISVIGGGFVQTFTSDFDQVTIGASGGVFGVMLAFICLFPKERLGILLTPFSVPALWLVMGYIITELYFILYSPVPNVAHYAHLGGAVTGLLFGMVWRKSLFMKNNP